MFCGGGGRASILHIKEFTYGSVHYVLMELSLAGGWPWQHHCESAIGAAAFAFFFF